MSHFTVAVFTDNETTVDSLLEPYDERKEVEVCINRTREDMISDARSRAEFLRKRKIAGEIISEYEQKYLMAKTDEELYDLERDDDEEYDDDGNELTTCNPDAKWDWYTIGGRWKKAFTAYGIDPYGTRVGDIKVLFDPDCYKRASRFWELYVEGQEPMTDEDKQLIKFEFYQKEYYLERYVDKETYAQCRAAFSTFAVITPDGIWHEQGEMGWFGMSSETNEDGLDWEKNYIERFIKTADPNWTLYIVDCHI